jgi:hypothetical protein
MRKSILLFMILGVLSIGFQCSERNPVSTHGAAMIDFQLSGMVLNTSGQPIVGLWACGCNDSSQFGNGTKKAQLTPLQIMSEVRSFATGAENILILKQDNSLWGCGANLFGQLGTRDMLNRPTPVRIVF